MGNFASHTNHPDWVFVRRHFIFYSLPLLLFEVFFQSEASLIIHFWAAVCQYRSAVGGFDTQTFLMCVRKLCYIKRPKHTPQFVFQPCTDTLSESFHLSRHPEDSLQEPYVSSASSQQQSQDHHALLSYHANEAGIQTSGPQTDY